MCENIKRKESGEKGVGKRMKGKIGIGVKVEIWIMGDFKEEKSEMIKRIERMKIIEIESENVGK